MKFKFHNLKNRNSKENTVLFPKFRKRHKSLKNCTKISTKRSLKNKECFNSKQLKDNQKFKTKI